MHTHKKNTTGKKGEEQAPTGRSSLLMPEPCMQNYFVKPTVTSYRHTADPAPLPTKVSYFGVSVDFFEQ